jgi:hypothetical protein
MCHVLQFLICLGVISWARACAWVETWNKRESGRLALALNSNSIGSGWRTGTEEIQYSMVCCPQRKQAYIIFAVLRVFK